MIPKPYYQDEHVTLYCGDCVATMKTMPDNSVDSIVTDPPYGLGFMGKGWDATVPGVEVWIECLRVLKPGGHLLAFAGTRTQHRMACAIEDAGFEIRDMIAWVYGSGFPKSLDVSKAIDKAAGATRERGTPGRYAARRPRDEVGALNAYADGVGDAGSALVTAPATDAARQWQGWGTALKPSLETVTWARKPLLPETERRTILSNLSQMEARLWLLFDVSAADHSSTSSQSEFVAACDIAQWTAEDVTHIRVDLFGQMDTSQYVSAVTSSLNIVSSWRHTLEESWSDGNTSTTGTESSQTIDLKTLRFSLSQITPKSMVESCSLTGGFNANASTAERYFSDCVSLLQNIRKLSATGLAMSLAQRSQPDETVKPKLDPIVMARKPLIGTVAANVLEYGTGGINVDACRVAGEMGPDRAEGKPRRTDNTKYGKANETINPQSELGRWACNLISIRKFRPNKWKELASKMH